MLPGYWIAYWPGQPRSFDGTYLSNAMAADYAHEVEGSPKFKEFILNLLEESLKRVGIPVKAYLWVLQNPDISAVISNPLDEQHVIENLSVVGKKVELQPG